jgi:hypothetical protein
MRTPEDSAESRSEHDRQELLARLRVPQPEDVTLPAEADRYLRHNPDDAEVREARERLPELDQSE